LEILGKITGLPTPNLTIPVWIPLIVAWIDEKILANLGKQPSVPLDGVKMSSQLMYYNPSKAVRELGLPQSSITKALETAVIYFREQLQL
jgi:dihydroflavonol-4-reductase